MEELSLQLEAIIFASTSPVNIIEMSNLIKQVIEGDVEDVEIKAALKHIQKKYNNDKFAFELMEKGEDINSLRNLNITKAFLPF